MLIVLKLSHGAQVIIFLFIFTSNVLPPLRRSLPFTDSGQLEFMALPPLLMVCVPLYQMLMEKFKIGAAHQQNALAETLSPGLNSDGIAVPVEGPPRHIMPQPATPR